MFHEAVGLLLFQWNIVCVQVLIANIFQGYLNENEVMFHKTANLFLRNTIY